MVAQVCDYVKNHKTVVFRRVNFRLCEVYLNTVAKKKNHLW